MSRPTLEPITVNVVLADTGLSVAERSLLEGRVADDALGLINDLHLPAVAQVRLVDRPHDDRQGSARMAIAIEGQLCRQPMLSFDEEQNSDLSELASFASSVLYANRQLLLTKRVLCAITTAHPANVAGLMPEMVRRGFSLEVAEAIAGKINPSLDVESRRYQVELLLSEFAPETLTIEAGECFHRQIKNSSTSNFSEMIGMMRDGLFYDLGVKPPPVRLILNEALAAFDFRIQLGCLRGSIHRGLQKDELLIKATAADLADALKIDARPARNPVTGETFAIVTGEDAVSRCEQEGGLTCWDAGGYAVLAVSQAIRANAELFLTAACVQRMLAKLSEAFPLLIVNLLERFAPRFVLDVLRALVREGFSIRDLRGVIESMLELNGEITRIADGEIAILPPAARLSRFAMLPIGREAAEHCADNVRVAMKQYVTAQFAQGGNATVLETTDAMEARLRGCQGRIRGKEHESLIGAIAALSEDRIVSEPLVLLTAVDVRRRLREAIEIEFPHVPVLSREEIDDLAVFRNRGSIAWE